MATAAPPMARKAKAPPAIGKASFFFFAGSAAALAAAGAAGSALRSTIGLGRVLIATGAVVVVVSVLAVVTGAAAGVRATLRLTVLVVTGTDLAATAFFWVFTDLVVVVSVTAGVETVSAGELASGAIGAGSATAGAGWAAVVSTGGSVGTG